MLKDEIINHFERCDAYAVKIGTTCHRKLTWSSAAQVVCQHLNPTGIAMLNGPTTQYVGCSNEVGRCGCCHAEPKVILSLPRECRVPTLMFTKYSPCTTCANLIIISKRVTAVLFEIQTTTDMRGLDLLGSARIPVAELITLKEDSKLYAQFERELLTNRIS